MRTVCTKDRGILVLLLFFILISCLPLFKDLPNINANLDWLQMLSYYKADRQAILEHGQWPLRTHFFGGGYPLIANPQDGSLNPFLIPVLALGEVVGMKVNVFLAHLIAAFGMYYLTRHVLGFPLLGSLFSVVVFCLGGHMHRLLIRGQDYITLFYLFLPLALALFSKAGKSRRSFLLCVFVLTTVATQAGLYFVPFVLFLFLWACLNPAYLKYFFMVVAGVFLLGAVKFLPMLELIAQNPRAMSGYNPFWEFSLGRLYDTFFVHHAGFAFAGQHWTYHYLGFVPIVFCFVAFFWRWRQTRSYFFLLVFFALLAFGGHTRFDLFQHLWRLPLLHSIETPSRYFSPLVIFLVALCAGEAFCLGLKFRSKIVISFAVLVLVFTAADLFWTNGTRQASFPVPVPAGNAKNDFYYVKNVAPTGKVSPLIPKEMFESRSWEWTRPSQYELMLENKGKVNSYVNIHLGEYVAPRFYAAWNGAENLNPGNYFLVPNIEYQGEAYFVKKGRNSVVLTDPGPNVIRVDADVEEPDLLVINQNFDKRWHSDRGPVLDYHGLLAVELNKQGPQTVKFSYVPWSLYLGLVVSLGTLGAMIYVFRKAKKC